MDALLERLHSVLDELAALDCAPLADPAAVVMLRRARSRLDSVVCRQAAAVHASAVWVAAGAQNASAWITTTCRTERRLARRHVRLGQALHAMDATAPSFAAGRITAEHVEVLSQARDRSPATARAFGRDEAMLLSWAEEHPFHRFRSLVQAWLRTADEEGAEADADRRHEARRVHLSRSFEDTWFLDGVLDPVNGEIVAETLTMITDELFEADWKQAKELLGATPTGEQLRSLTRSAPQRRADALVEMATRARTAPVGGRRPKPLFTVLVGETDFARTIELASGSTTTPGSLARWIDESVIERVVFDGPDRVLAVGTQREFRGALRRAIEVRDRTCGSAYCEEPATRCEVDHILPDSAGGPTTQENGRLFCRFHHRLHHRAENHPGFPADACECEAGDTEHDEPRR